MKRAKNPWVLTLLVLAGIVLGSFIATIAAGVPGVSWLAFGQTFGLHNPFVLDLGIIVITFALTIPSLNFMFILSPTAISDAVTILPLSSNNA